MLTDIGRLGETLAGTSSKTGSADDSGVIGRSLQLAARRPAEVLRLPGRRQAGCGVLGLREGGGAGCPAERPAACSRAGARTSDRGAGGAPVTAARVGAPGIPWLRTLLAALPFLLLLLAGAWLLRSLFARRSRLSLATREGPPPLPPAHRRTAGPAAGHEGNRSAPKSRAPRRSASNWRRSKPSSGSVSQPANRQSRRHPFPRRRPRSP